MAVPLCPGRKPRASLPGHYYEGYLEKKAPWEKEYKKFWAGLRGLRLYFYYTNRAIQYVELLDLSDFVSLVDDDPPRTVAGWTVEEAKLTLRMRSQEVQLKVTLLGHEGILTSFAGKDNQKGEKIHRALLSAPTGPPNSDAGV
ncbi:signal-transducing adaptor protein 2 [Sphaerodactylus townsendi]|uniref:Uncharacterized protein n=1 Tax=Sphaerodactylus townsendi TaxID=933632 RepID=A0ACB8F1Q4_9SAUR|nr:signal-transducing adaptor protein 2 [Sphaerodactylus townsendi]